MFSVIMWSIIVKVVLYIMCHIGRYKQWCVSFGVYVHLISQQSSYAHIHIHSYIKKQTPWSESASELCRLSDRRLSAKHREMLKRVFFKIDIFISSD
jgi:hypothetical protein